MAVCDTNNDVMKKLQEESPQQLTWTIWQ